jgi:hypothetical protein
LYGGGLNAISGPGALVCVAAGFSLDALPGAALSVAAGSTPAEFAANLRTDAQAGDALAKLVPAKPTN